MGLPPRFGNPAQDVQQQANDADGRHKLERGPGDRRVKRAAQPDIVVEVAGQRLENFGESTCLFAHADQVDHRLGKRLPLCAASPR